MSTAQIASMLRKMVKIPQVDWSSGNPADALALFKQIIAYFLEDENGTRH